MKNKIKYFVLYPLMLLIVIATLTYDVKELIGLGQRIPFGSSYWKDSLNDAISTNKSIKLGTGDSLYYNGVVVTSGTGGGGIAASDNTTFTGINTFTDSLRANGYSIIDDAKITSYLRVTGEVTTDLNFNKGSSTSIGTISTDSLAFITNDTNRIVIDKNGYTVFTDTVQMLDRVYISGNLNVASNIYTIGNITADSIAGIGKFITEVDAITLKGQDTTHYAHTDTLTTENIKGVWNFWNVVSFLTVPTIPSFFQNAARTIQYYLPNSASDTLATISQTQTLTNKTISGSANTITNLPRGIMTLWNANLPTPADATTYYGGGFSGEAPNVTESVMRTYIPTDCTIKGVSCYAWNGATTPNPTGQAITVSIGVNGSYTQISNAWLWDTPSAYNAVTNTSLNISVTAGQYITMKILTPTWATTNPINVRTMYTIYFE